MTMLSEALRAMLNPGRFSPEEFADIERAANELTRLAKELEEVRGERDKLRAPMTNADFMEAQDLGNRLVGEQSLGSRQVTLRHEAAVALLRFAKANRAAEARALAAESSAAAARRVVEAARLVVISTSKLYRLGIPDTDMVPIMLGKLRALDALLPKATT